MEKQPDEPEDVTNEPLSSMSEPMEVQDAVASTLATPFEQPIIFTYKSKAQKQREYRQRIAASITPAQAAAARKSKNERQRRLRQAANLANASGSLEATTAAPKTRAQIQREYRQRLAASRTPAQAAAAREARNVRDRNYRLRQAANFAVASGSLEARTASSSRSGQRLNSVHIDDTQRQFADEKRQSLATEPEFAVFKGNRITSNLTEAKPRAKQDSVEIKNDVKVFCTDISHTAQAIQEEQTKIHIAKLYHYFEQEYEELKTIYGDLDLTPLSNFCQRTARATGVSETTVVQILNEKEARNAEKLQETNLSRARTRSMHTDSLCEEDDSDDIADPDENSIHFNGAETLLVKVEPEDYDNDEPGTYLPAAVKQELGDSEVITEQPLIDPIPLNMQTGPESDIFDQSGLLEEAEVKVEEIEIEEEGFS